MCCATAEYLGQDRLDQEMAEEALVPHRTICRPVGRGKLSERVFVSPKEFDELAAEEPDILSAICLKEIIQYLPNLLSTLSGDEKQVVEAYYFHETPLRQIPDRLSMSWEDVRSHIVRGVGKMRREAQKLRIS